MFLFCFVVCQRIDGKAIILVLIQYKKVKTFFISLTIFILMDCPIYIDTIRAWNRPFFNLRDCRSNILEDYVFLSLKIVLF